MSKARENTNTFSFGAVLKAGRMEQAGAVTEVCVG